MELKKLFQSLKASFSVSDVVIDVVLVVALIPVVSTFARQKYECLNASFPTLVGDVCSNTTANISATGVFSTSEVVLLGLTTLFIILGLVFMIGRQTGLIKK